MHLEPLGPYLTVRLIPPAVPRDSLWQPQPNKVAREAIIILVGPEVPDLKPNTAVLISTRYVTQVGDTFLLHHSGVLGTLAYSAD